MQYLQVVNEYHQIKEQYSMLLEDLNAKLIEREELINSREDIDLVLEKEDPVLFQYATSQQQHQINQFHIQNTLDELNESISQLNFERQQLQYSFCEDKGKTAQLYLQNTKKLQNSYQQVCLENKRLNSNINSLEMEWGKVEQKVIQNANLAFKEYYQNQVETFRNLKKSYGEDAYYKIIKEHQEQLQTLIMDEYQTKIENIKKLKKQQELLCTQLQKNVEYVQCHLQAEIQSLSKQMNLKKDLLSQFKKYDIQNKENTQKMEKQKSEIDFLFAKDIISQEEQVSKCSSSQTKNRSYSEINKYKKKGNHSALNEDTQLILNQISFDDSLIQNLQDMGENDKSMNMPLQTITQETQQSSNENEYLQVQTITEIVQNSTRNNQNIKPLFNFTLSNPSTNKAKKNSIYLQMKENMFHSDQCNKINARSKSVDQTQKKSFTRKQSIQTQQVNQEEKRSPIKELLNKIKPILQGLELYKRFSNAPEFKRQEYNSRLNPQQCGYGYRRMNLSQKLDKLEFRNLLKPQIVEQSIKINEILRVQVSRQSNDQLGGMSIITEKQGRVELLVEKQVASELQRQLLLVRDNAKSLIQVGRRVE